MINSGDRPYQIEKRIQELDFSVEYEYSEIFQIVCREFSLDAVLYEELLGCQCPFGLIGFLQEDKEG